MDDHNSNMDFTELFKMIQTMSKSQPKSEPARLSDVDRLVNNQQMRILKATLPYFDYSVQRDLIMILKIMEFKRTMEIFNQPIEVHTQQLPAKERDKLAFLTDIRNSCDEPSQKKINSLIMMMNLQKSMEATNNNRQLSAPEEEKKEDKKEVKEASANDGYDSFMNMMNKILKEKESH